MLRKRLAGRFLRTTMLSGVAAAAAMPAFAQDEGEDDVIIVSGTRIQREDLAAPSPVTTVDSEQLVLTNTVNSEQFLNTLPQVIPSFDSTSNNPGDGSSRVNLRGLGTQRTLVLVDGARFVGLGPSFVVDLNNIPAALVERIDVVTGGASAVYGSDAMAGVVNFVLKDDFQGIQLDVSDEMSASGWDANTFNASLTLGGDFADGRGNAVVFASYTNREALFQGDRAFSRDTLQDLGPGATEFGFTGSANIPGALVSNPTFDNFGLDVFDANGVRQPSTNTNFAATDTFADVFSECSVGCTGFRVLDGASGTAGVRLGPSPNDTFNYAPDNYLQLPQERYNISAFGTFEINDHIEAYARGVFSETVVDSQLAPTPAGLSVTINLDNPALQALPTALALIEGSDANNGDGTATVFFTKRYEEVGTRNSLRDTSGFQILTGLRGDISPNWSYDTFFNFSRSTVVQTQTGNISASAVQAAVLCDGGPTAIASGCTAPYMDLFGGPGGISPEAATFISRTGAQVDQIEQTQWVGLLEGNLDTIKTPWAESGAAVVFGLEYRENWAKSQPDSVLGPDVRGFNSSLPVGGRYDVYEAFTEINIPLIQGVTGIENFGINGAYRYSDYSIANVGSTHTFAVGADWEVVPGFRVRGQFQRAVRAPNIGELFRASTNGFPGAQDPCSGGPNGSFSGATIVQTCIDTGVPSGNVGTNIQPNGQIQVLGGGNPNLFEETADTWTVGAVWQPEQVPGLNVQVDYYNITIDDVITQLAFQTVLDECHLQGISSQCDIVAQGRNPANGILGQGAPFLSSLGVINAAQLKASGIDGRIGYSFDMGEGSVSINYYGTYTLENSLLPSPTTALIECAGYFSGQCGEPLPEYKHTAQIGYLWGPLTTSVRWRLIGGVDLDPSTFPTPSSSFSDLSDDIGMYNYLDVTMQYAVNENLDLTVGVQNITGKDAPLLGSTVNEQANTWPATYETLGRQLFVGASVRF
ncbi:MAG: hypothetical protein CMI63_15135 [Parvularcula sp.]|uniref:TonB-dependent receptor domain-containing protein n=1 Tax=Hyphococcus sp. TaxID=2038636 RepID=UPI000C3F2812|nr:hypothetical protein [Parvularcula sp.]